MARPGLILDRDGTINEDRGHIGALDDFVLLPGAEAAMARARRAGATLAVVTNQSAIARGILTEAVLEEMNGRLLALGVARVYHCPHLAGDGCTCRKPLPGMVERAIGELDLDPARSMLVGDHLTDCQAAAAAGVAAVLVRTGHGAEHADDAAAEGFPVVDDLPAAVEHYLREAGLA